MAKAKKAANESAIEKELIEASGFEPRRNYAERQDYLAALARAVQDMDEDDFDKVSNEAADWYNAAVDAINDKSNIPDFDDAEKAAEPETAEPADAEVEEGTEVEAEEEADAEVEEEAEPEEKAPRSRRGKAPDKPASKGKAETKGKAALKDKNAPKAEPEPRQPAKKAEATTTKRAAPVAGLRLDKWDIAEGTKNSQAAAMLEKGAKMADVNKEVGGTYYNLLKRLVKQGHKLLKEPNGELRLVHKDEYGKKAKGKK